jgi:hypothetical protein
VAAAGCASRGEGESAPDGRKSGIFGSGIRGSTAPLPPVSSDSSYSS